MVAAFEAPAFAARRLLVSLRHPDEYPMNEGRIVSNDGLDLAGAGLGAGLPRGTGRGTSALHARTLDGEAYLLGPTARIALAGDRLHPLAGRRSPPRASRRAGDQRLQEHPCPGRRARACSGRSSRSDRRLRASVPAAVDWRPVAGTRGMGDRGAARPALPSIRRRRGGNRPDGANRAAHVPEPPQSRRTCPLRAIRHRPAARRGDETFRAASFGATTCISCAAHSGSAGRGGTR